MRRPASPWTEERTELLAAMKCEPPVGILEALRTLDGPPLTRCAVIGKRDRMFGVRQPKKTQEERAAMALAQRDKENALARAKRAANRQGVNFNRREAALERKANGGDPGLAPSIDAVDSTPRHISLAELTDHTCKWPYGDGDPSTFTFCGAHPKEGKPYCECHAALAYQPLPSRGKPYLVLGNTRGGVFRRSA